MHFCHSCFDILRRRHLPIQHWHLTEVATAFSTTFAQFQGSEDDMKSFSAFLKTQWPNIFHFFPLDGYVDHFRSLDMIVARVFDCSSGSSSFFSIWREELFDGTFKKNPCADISGRIYSAGNTDSAYARNTVEQITKHVTGERLGEETNLIFLRFRWCIFGPQSWKEKASNSMEGPCRHEQRPKSYFLKICFSSKHSTRLERTKEWFGCISGSQSAHLFITEDAYVQLLQLINRDTSGEVLIDCHFDHWTCCLF